MELLIYLSVNRSMFCNLQSLIIMSRERALSDQSNFSRRMIRWFLQPKTRNKQWHVMGEFVFQQSFCEFAELPLPSSPWSLALDSFAWDISIQLSWCSMIPVGGIVKMRKSTLKIETWLHSVYDIFKKNSDMIFNLAHYNQNYFWSG